MHALLRLAGWIGLSFVPGLIGAPFPAPDWYRRLSKPAWAPPASVFGPVWTLLYLLMGIAAWRVESSREPGARSALRAFRWQLVLNGAWTPIFFGLRRLDLAFAEIVATWFAILVTTARFARVRVMAGLLLLPYLGWVTFATALNWSIWRRNR
jgi:tryptophan-rich sensory protein